MSAGISAIGVYLPRNRLQRSAIAAANAWANPALTGLARGAIAAANWDEDAVTMACEAALSAGAAESGPALRQLSFCSTSMPFADRSQGGLIAAALSLPDDVAVHDVAASQRSATSALRRALESTGSGDELVVAAERRVCRPASTREIGNGDGAAAVITGNDGLIAEYLGGASIRADFVDHYRASDARFDYAFEERWVRDEGYLKLLPEAARRAFAAAGIEPSAVTRVAAPVSARLAATLASACGISAGAVPGTADAAFGDTGTAAALVALAEALESAGKGEVVLCLGFGQGADALLLRSTGLLARTPERHSVAAALKHGRADENYLRYLSHRGLVEIDWGMRAERDQRTAQSAYYRQRDQITGFVGGRCRRCGTAQFPRTPACVNPDCRAFGEQDAYAFAARTGRVKSFTEDWQAFSPAPPLVYGNVTFGDGANILMQFTDCAPGEVRVGQPVSMHLRIKDFDRLRHFRRYFWKAIPRERSDG